MNGLIIHLFFCFQIKYWGKKLADVHRSSLFFIGIERTTPKDGQPSSKTGHHRRNATQAMAFLSAARRLPAVVFGLSFFVAIPLFAATLFLVFCSSAVPSLRCNPDRVFWCVHCSKYSYWSQTVEGEQQETHTEEEMAGVSSRVVIWLHGLGDSGPANEGLASFFKGPSFAAFKWFFPSAPEQRVTCNCTSLSLSLPL
jgi:hypothetical protein